MAASMTAAVTTKSAAMTDRYGRSGNWAAPAVLAPCAAALFGASVWWAIGATPTTTATQQSTAPASDAAHVTQQSRAVQHYLAQVAAQRRALHRELTQALTQRRHEAEMLARRLHHVHAEIARAKAAAARAAAYVPPVYTGIPASGPAPVAPVQVGPAPAPAPPPVQANTGASGAAP
jgi:hypothetical protein